MSAGFSGTILFTVLRTMMLAVLGGDSAPAPDAVVHIKFSGADGLEICHLPDARNVLSAGRIAAARFRTFDVQDVLHINVRILHLKKTIGAMADVTGKLSAGTEEATIEITPDESIKMLLRRNRTGPAIVIHTIGLSSGSLVVPRFQQFVELADNRGLDCMVIATPLAFKKVVEKLVKSRGNATCRITVTSAEELAEYNEPGGLLIHIANGPTTMLAKFEPHGEVIGDFVCRETKTYCFHQSGVAKVLACIGPDIKAVKLCFVDNGIHWLFYDFSLTFIAQHFSIVVNQSLLSEEQAD